MFHSKKFHEFALKRLARYLKHTQVCGLMLDPNSDIFNFSVYPDANFAGMYGHEKPDDLTCSKSCTGFKIMFSGCPLLCISKLKN